jgi:hypothetical protein
MPVKKRVKKEKSSKRGKGDVKQSVKVSVKIGDVKPKRRRQYKRKPKGEGTSDLARVGETGTLYGNLPPQTITIQPQQPLLQLPPAFQEQPKIAGLLEDVKRERQNLLEDIKRETQQQISKAQGAEQRAELLRLGWTEPVPKPPSIEESIESIAPSFTDIAKITSSKPSQPIIEEVTGKRGRRKGSKNKPKMAVEAKQVELPKGSKIPVPDLEKMPTSSLRAETFNLV